ncbi:dnaJ homolog subfamily C member 1 [Orussus abietinus]|uniref:dnaJ homolog subfamily C member 1 n=1 Tax=Orussus abietinus TaxID=222816 RepID=UPI000625AFBF|nr:dnaJ homolog subfamily C member 1 [Orussus abietinus]
MERKRQVTLVLGVLQVFLCSLATAWDNDQLEVFDVVEEVNRNFYDLLGVPQAANASEIRKAFRRLSLQLHPDKNPAEDAEQQFRHLVAVYDVLKDPGKRELYDDVLVNGLPNWRSAVYYYRRVRKMGLLEMSVILFILTTIGQYLVAWAAYFEKRYTYEQVLGSKLQKMQKKSRKSKVDVPDLADILEKIPTPSVKNTLPFQLPRWTFASIVGIPSAFGTMREVWEERKRRKKLEEEETQAQETEEVEPEPIPRGPKRRRAAFTPQERQGEDARQLHEKENNRSNHVYEKPKLTGGLWTDDDLAELIHLVKKYPGGTTDRWEKIADTMNRTVAEVTHMAKKIKDEGLKPGQAADEVPAFSEEPSRKIKTRGESSEPATEWSQEEQRALEAALIKYPKGNSIDRWERIATCVEGKSKEECQARYRQLVDLVKKKRHPQ